jgi:hypothetical protein
MGEWLKPAVLKNKTGVENTPKSLCQPQDSANSSVLDLSHFCAVLRGPLLQFRYTSSGSFTEYY